MGCVFMKKFLFGATAAVSALFAMPASAAVYVLGSFTVPPTAVVNFTPTTITNTGGFQDEFRFTLLSTLTLTVGGFNTSAIPGINNLDFGAVELRSGLGNSGTLVGSFINGGNVAGFETSSLGEVRLAAGDYTIVVNGNVTKGPARYDGNAVFAAVPEPATWAMMLGGFGLLGGAVRRSRRATTVLA